MVQILAGGAGFIGTHLANALLAAEGAEVIVLDNLSRGRAAHLEKALKTGRCALFEVDCGDDPSALKSVLSRALRGRHADAIWHMAANSDIPSGIADPRIDLRDTFMTTFNLLEAMREFAIPKFHFASSSAVYGDHGEAEIHEHTPPRPISTYGAMKLASEAHINASLESFGERATIFRFPNVVGAPATHGVLFDFVRKLKADPTCLTVLGDGTQQKVYLHVSDLVEAMLYIASRGVGKVGVYNIGPPDKGVSVRFIAQTVAQAMSLTPRIEYGHGPKGWVGDVPKFHYSTARLAKLGWQPKHGSESAVRRAIEEIVRTVS